MRSPLFILLAAFILSLLVAQQFSSTRLGRTPDAVDLMQDLLGRRPALGAAIAAADRHDQGPLLAWLNSADSIERIGVEFP